MRNGSTQLGTYSLNFTRSNQNYATITDDGSGDGDGSVMIYYNSNYQSVGLSFAENASGSYRLSNISITQLTNSIDIQNLHFTNPKTGYNVQDYDAKAPEESVKKIDELLQANKTKQIIITIVAIELILALVYFVCIKPKDHRC